MKLEVKNLRKTFGEKEVLHGISFQVESGAALGLLGRNGAGKTTTMRILMDVFRANSGEILLDGKPFKPSDYKIGYLPEERGLYPKRVILEQMVFLARLKGISKTEAEKSARRWLERLEILEYEKKKLETLSKGNQQKVQLAASLVCNPDIVILDEPFSGLDPVNSQILKDVVNELIGENRLVIFSSHQMSYVEEFCDNIAIINNGEVVLSGKLRDIKKEYGKDRLMLAAENYSQEQLEGIIETQLREYVSICDRKKGFLVMQMKDNADKKDVLNQLIQTDIDIEVFGRFEPSLNDIFVEKAGEDA